VPTVQISRGVHISVTNSLGRQSQRIQNADDEKESVPRTDVTNGTELQCIHPPLELLNSKNLLRQQN
jgi:hypothetical protein